MQRKFALRPDLAVQGMCDVAIIGAALLRLLPVCA
jgi:hypothetical protein